MSFSAFDVIGPAMVGPSSSHTAGAVRIGLVAQSLLEDSVHKASIELHGSFAATGKGHATDKALVAGLLGFNPDDERLKDSLSIAKEQGCNITFTQTDLGEDHHPNTVRMTVESAAGEKHRLVGSSVGGGQIEIKSIDDYPTFFGGELETLILWNPDKPGYIAKVTTVLSCVEANIATIRTSRGSRGTEALTVIEVDGHLIPECLSLISHIPQTLRLRFLNRLP